VRTLTAHGVTHPPPIYCSAILCPRTTTGGKPVCSHHIHLMPAYTRIRKHLQHYETQMQRNESHLKRLGIDPNGWIAMDVLCALLDAENKTLTKRRISKDIKLSVSFASQLFETQIRLKYVSSDGISITLLERGLRAVLENDPVRQAI